MTTGPGRVPSEGEWKRLESGFAALMLVTVAVAIVFIAASPFPPTVGAVLMAPPVIGTAWLWIIVIRGRDADRLYRLSSFAARHRRRRPRRPRR